MEPPSASGDESSALESGRLFRTVVRSARFTVAEWLLVRARAARVGLSPGRYLRHAALGARLGGRVDERALAALGKIGANLNQLARAANTAGELVAHERLEAALGELRSVLSELGRRA
jgi:hypothetical protein